MKSWKTATRAVALGAAAVLVAALGPVVHGQMRAEQASRALEVLSGRGGGEIGVSIRDVEVDSAKGGNASAGVLIEEVTADGPADKAGIRKGDVVAEFDGERVRSVRQFTRIVQETPPGRRVPALITRDGQRINVTVEPRAGSRIRLLGDLAGERVLRDFGREWSDGFLVPPVPPAAPSAPAPPPPPPAPMFPDIQSNIWRSEAGLGITVAPLSSQLADYFGAKRGILVTAVRDNSAARTAGFKAGDVVTALNGSDVSEPADLRRRTQRLQDGDEFTAEVVRDKKPLTLKGKIERRTTRGATRVAR